MARRRPCRRPAAMGPERRTSSRGGFGLVVGLLGLLVSTALGAVVAPTLANAGTPSHPAASVRHQGSVRHQEAVSVMPATDSEESACSPAQEYYSRATET